MNDNIKRLRQQAGFTQTKLAQLLGVKQNTITQWEKGDRKPTIDMIPRLAAALHCSIEVLFAACEKSA